MFSKGSDGKYISSLGKYMILEEKAQTKTFTIPSRGNIPGGTRTVKSAYTLSTKDGEEYRFDASGKLALYMDNNENALFFDYDHEKGLLTKVTTGRNISLDISYCDEAGGANPLCISEITMPDEGRVTYQYQTNGMLKKAVRHASSGSGTITYNFSYSSAGNSYPSLSKITDPKGNSYNVSYTSKKASKLLYPDNSALRLTYSSGSTVMTQTAAGLTLDTQTDYFNDEGNCIKTVDKNGLETTYSYSDDMLVETRSQVEYEELVNGQVVIKQGVNVDTSEYDEDKYLTEEEDDAGNTTSYEYYGSGACEGLEKKEKEESGDGVITSNVDYQYDSKGNETSSVDSVTGEKTVTTYYGASAGNGIAGQVKKETEYKNNKQTGVTNYNYSYNSSGELTETATETSDGFTTVNTTVYDAMGRTLSESKNNGVYEEETEYIYDGFGRQTGTSHRVGNETKTTQTTYDANGNVLTQTAEDGTSTTNTYDNMNRSTSTVTSKSGQSTTTTNAYSYTNTSVNGKQIPVQVTQTNTNGVISKTYSDGENTVREEANGMATEYDLDASGNTVAEYTVGTSGGRRLDTAYVTDMYGEQTCEISKPTVVNGKYTVSDDSTVDQSTHDSLGNTKTEEDANGNVTRYSYDAQSRETRVELADGTGRDISYTVQSNGGEKETVTDPNGNTSFTLTSPGGNETKVSDIGSGSVTPIEKTYTYDAEGNVIRQEEAEGNYKTFTYNARSENTVTNCYDKNGVNTLRTQYTYDDNGNILTMKDLKKEGSSMVMFRYAKFGYDSLGRKTSEAEFYGSSMPTDGELSERAITYQYDSKGRVSAISYPPVLASTYSVTGLRYVYDTYNRLSQIKAVTGSSEKLLRAYTYDQYGMITERKDYRDFASGGSGYIRCRYSYDDLDRVTSMEYSDSARNGVFESYALTYDKAGSITREEIVNSLPANEEEKVNEIRDYEYDSLGRLISTEITAQPDGDPVRTEYTYDPAGNRLSMTEGDNNTQYTYNSLDQLTGSTVTEDGTTASVTTSAYNKNGNLISQETSANNDGTTETETKAYSYDPNNMMAGCVISQDGTVSVDQTCIYNGDGQRTYKADGEDNTRYYYMAGHVLYTESDISVHPEEGDGEGNAPGGDEEDPVETKITSFNILSPEGGLIASGREGENSDEYFVYTKDVRGSITNIVDVAGTAAASYTYSDFGETTANNIAAGDSTTGETAEFYNEICYTGGIYDENTGEYYLNARYYDSSDGRFTTQDSYRGENTDEGTWNLYAYCAGDPVNHTDPSGHAAIVLKSNFMGAEIGHLAVLIKHGGNWRYFSWGIKGYKSPYLNWKANTKKYKSVKKGEVRKAINKRFKRNEKNEKYRKYLYIKGNFSKCKEYIDKVKAGKSFRGYSLTGVNCAWMVLEVLRHGKISAKKNKALFNMQYIYSRNPETGGYEWRPRTIIPSKVFKKLKTVFGVQIKNVKKNVK